MDIKNLFTPGPEVMEKMDILAEEYSATNIADCTESIDRSGDCTGCWGGTCAHGITG